MILQMANIPFVSVSRAVHSGSRIYSYNTAARANIALRVVAFLTVFALLVWLIRTQNDHSSSKSVQRRSFYVNPRVEETFSKWKKCIMKEYGRYVKEHARLYNDLYSVADKCKILPDVAPIKIRNFTGEGEPKYHVLAQNNTARCVIVTLGIGRETLAEKKLLAAIPHCHFHGADPIQEENNAMYSKFGKYYPVAVGGETGIQSNSVLVGRGYANQYVVQIDLVTFLNKFVKESFIDNLLIDTEGSEEQMFEYFYDDSQLDANNIIICQFNMEVHRASSGVYDRMHKFLLRLAVEGRYALLRAEYQHFNRLYFLNHREPACVKKYLDQFYR